jgi:hypothetical protein
LTRFGYEIVYRPGKLNRKVAALTRRLGDLPERGDERLQNMEQVVLKSHNLPEQLQILANNSSVQKHPLTDHLFVQPFQADPLVKKVLKAVREKDSLKEITINQCSEQDGLIRYQGKRYVPEGDQ